MTQRNTESDMLRKIREYFQTTPRSEVLRAWEETKALDLVGPTVAEFLGWNDMAIERCPRIQTHEVQPTMFKSLSAEKYNSNTTLYMCC